MTATLAYNLDLWLTYLGYLRLAFCFAISTLFAKCEMCMVFQLCSARTYVVQSADSVDKATRTLQSHSNDLIYQQRVTGSNDRQ